MSLNFFSKIIRRSFKGKIYLTFDDGPILGTRNSYQICKEIGVKSTFFMVGIHANNRRSKLLLKEVNECYPMLLIGNHSFSHAKLKYNDFYNNPTNAFYDFVKAESILSLRVPIARLPGSNSWILDDQRKYSSMVSELCNRLDKRGYNIIGWDFEWSNNNYKEDHNMRYLKIVEDIYMQFFSSRLFTDKNIVILLHDWMFTDEQNIIQLKKLIIYLKEDGLLQFETIENYPGLKKTLEFCDE